MTYKELEQYLFSISDSRFASFSKSLSNSNYISIGVKNPVLRQIIKEHKDDKELDLEDFKLGTYLEVDFIYFGLALSRLKTIDEQLDFLLKKIRLAKSWAITDCVTTFLKKMSFSQYKDFFMKVYKSKYTYERRMGYILGLKQSKDEKVLSLLPLIQFNEEYMVMMSEAWLLSVIAISFEKEVYLYLEDISDITLKRKTISKINESFRFSKESKQLFKGLRN